MDRLENRYHENAGLLKALGHPVRLCIANGLLEAGDCNVTFMQQCLDLPQSSISSHLQKLRAAGIVKCRRQGLEVTYRLANEQVASMLRLLFQS